MDSDKVGQAFRRLVTTIRPRGGPWWFTSDASDALKHNGERYHTLLLGPELEWLTFPCAELFNEAQQSFFTVVEPLLLDLTDDEEFEGPFSEAASTALRRNS